jgi:TctA family transporter
MDLFSNLALGFGVALSLKNLALCFTGCFIGTLIGVLPGVGPIATIAMLLPITFGIDPVGALIMLLSIMTGFLEQTRTSMRGSLSSATPGGWARRGPTKPTGEARSENTGSVSQFRPPT